MIARVFAETGIKDLYLDVHALLRKHASKEAITRLRGQWIPVDPSQWAERNQVTVEVGVGSGGKEQRLSMLTQVLTLQETIEKTAPGSGLVTPANVYAAATDAAKAGGLKQADSYFTDPTKSPPPPPQPNPDAIKAQTEAQASQAKAQLDQARLESDQQVAQGRLHLDAAKLQFEQQQAEAEREFRLQELQLKHQRELVSLHAESERETMRLTTDVRMREQELEQKQHQFEQQQQLARDTLSQTGELKITEIEAAHGSKIDGAIIKAASDALRMKTDLAVQDQKSVDAHLLAAGEHLHEQDMAEAAREAEPAPSGDAE
jgi:hypothetical protein